MNKRTSIILGTVAALIAGVLIAAKLLTGGQGTTLPGSITYTNGISGQSATDVPSEGPGQESDGVILPPDISVSGIDQTFNSTLTGEQAGNAYLAIKKFLFARSGLGTVRAAVESDSIRQSDQGLQFTLVNIRSREPNCNPPATDMRLFVTLETR